MKDETLCLEIRSPLLIFIEIISQLEKEKQVEIVFSTVLPSGLIFSCAFYYSMGALWHG